MKNKNADVLSREEVDKKNFGLSIINGIAFKAGFEYVNSYTIVSVFIHSLTGSVALSGLAQFIQTFARQLGRFLKASRIHAIKSQPLYMGKVNILSRALWIIVSVMLLFDVPNNILVPSIFIVMSVSWLLCGMTWPVFEDHLVRTILPRRRSELLGYREVLGGIAAFLGTLVVKSILGSGLLFNQKYAMIIFLGALFLLISAVPLFFMKDPYHKVDKSPMPLLKVLKNTRKILKKEKNYKWYLVSRSIWVITDCSLLYALVATKSIGDLSDVAVSYTITAQIVGRLVGGMLWGKVAKKQGTRISIIIVQLVNITIAGLMIFVLQMQNVSDFIYIALNFVIGLSIPAVLVSFVYFSEITKTKQRPRLVVIESAISMPLAFASYLFGIIAERFGFTSIYVILIVGAVLILMIAFFKMLKPKEIELLDC